MEDRYADIRQRVMRTGGSDPLVVGSRVRSKDLFAVVEHEVMKAEMCQLLDDVRATSTRAYDTDDSARDHGPRIGAEERLPGKPLVHDDLHEKRMGKPTTVTLSA